MNEKRRQEKTLKQSEGFDWETSIRPKPSQSPSRVIQGNVMAPIHFLVCETAKGVPASDVRTKEEKAGDKMQRVDEMKMCGLDCF